MNMKKSLLVAGICLGAAALSGTVLAASSPGIERSNESPSQVYTSDWQPPALREGSSSDVSDLANLAADLEGAPLAIEPMQGRRIGIQAMQSDGWCVQANRLGRSVVSWCGTYFGEEGVNYAYNSGNVPGIVSSLIGLAMPDVTQIRVKTTLAVVDVDIVDGGFWWEGSPDERIVELFVTRKGVTYSETVRFEVPPVEHVDYPVVVDE
jgi:hypothetical protein